MAQLAERRLVYEQQYHHDLELYQSERRTKIESANQIRPVTSPPNSQPQAINSTEHSDPRHQATSLTPTNDRAISLDDANTRRHAKPTEDLRDVFIDDLIGGEDELEDFYAD
ncbi:hypothetical protein SARC_13508 [Sphaeroforma arctica JP610]|uniref:Uncharacterized protein n=1 Tax=Sphaeroforma arctica JP610 TaxID=667725 RepID=A0A0L0FCX9_9EUKA|nr:hypothetical protein SARC_13508 [Sphaeroforma arctica JP610]KNC73933.1 hypothetical protein SARC_13508 [Sphaeroforma arctica JP610]|eukprot:XP_014147835.1 hypothetical protein SARC_13508 [Sphaeroforma arctica JP610]